MLAELHLHHVESEGLRLPDEILQRAIRGARVACGGEGTLHDLQICDEIVARLVHQVGVTLDRVMQTVCHHQHDSAVHLLGGD